MGGWGGGEEEGGFGTSINVYRRSTGLDVGSGLIAVREVSVT